MLRQVVQGGLSRLGLSLHRKSSIDQLLRQNEWLKRRLGGTPAPTPTPASPPIKSAAQDEEIARLRRELEKHEQRQVFYLTTEDYGAVAKTKKIVDGISDFGHADFADLSCWIFASSLINHRVVHQRVDEGSMLWRAVKMSGGPILEIGRAAGGSTLLLLGASGARPVVSIDRAPFHAWISQHVFERPDVAARLKLYVQTSREPIAENEFGLVFIDADHSYEGVCHDIASFWNSLRSFDGKPPLAAFHDGADNPITFVEPVKQACDELVAEPGAARIVESWGSMLVLEKTGDIDQDKWFKKEHTAFWEQFADLRHPVLKPRVLRGRLRESASSLQAATINLLGDENVDDPSWVKRGMNVERLQLNEDNPLRLLRVAAGPGEHGVEKAIPVNVARFNFSVFLRPHWLNHIRLSILDRARIELASADFDLGNSSKVARAGSTVSAEIIEASFDYRNSYFCCNLAVALPKRIESAIFSIGVLDGAGAGASFAGDGKSGIFLNLSSVRELV